MAEQQVAKKNTVRVPQPVSTETAIQLYYSKTELSNKDIAILFGKIGSARITKLKNLAEKKRKDAQVQLWNAFNVNTKIAYQAWGIDIDELERRYNRLKKLGLQEVG